MKILHSADWHAGSLLRRISRLEELRAALDEIVTIAEREGAKVLVMAGDIFDQKSPAPDAEQVVYEALVEFERRNIHVVMIAGNHDHPHRWRAVRPLLSRFHVHVVPEVSRPDQGGIIELTLTKGGPTLQVAALPWVPERRIVPAMALLDPNTPAQGKYADGMRGLIAALTAPLRADACTIFAGHLTVSGCRPGGGERELTLGEVYAIDPQAFPQVQYVALGHIHRPQAIKQTAIPARYSGSPLQLDFGETGYRTSVTLVELEPGLPAQVTEIPLMTGRALLDVHGPLDELAARKDEFGDAYLRVTVKVSKPLPGTGDLVRAVLPNALEIRLDYPRQAATPSATPLRSLSDRAQFARYLQERYETAPDDADLDLFATLMEEVTGGRI